MHHLSNLEILVFLGIGVWIIHKNVFRLWKRLRWGFVFDLELTIVLAGSWRLVDRYSKFMLAATLGLTLDQKRILVALVHADSFQVFCLNLINFKLNDRRKSPFDLWGYLSAWILLKNGACGTLLFANWSFVGVGALQSSDTIINFQVLPEQQLRRIVPDQLPFVPLALVWCLFVYLSFGTFEASKLFLCCLYSRAALLLAMALDHCFLHLLILFVKLVNDQLTFLVKNLGRWTWTCICGDALVSPSKPHESGLDIVTHLLGATKLLNELSFNTCEVLNPLLALLDLAIKLFLDLCIFRFSLTFLLCYSLHPIYLLLGL